MGTPLQFFPFNSVQQMNTKELVDTLLAARDAYYNSGTPLMSDMEFDNLEDELKGMDPNNAYFSSVGHLNETDKGKNCSRRTHAVHGQGKNSG